MTDSSREAEELFAQFLRRLEGGEELDFEEWVSAQGRMASELRELEGSRAGRVDRDEEESELSRPDESRGVLSFLLGTKNQRSPFSIQAAVSAGDEIGEFRLLHPIGSGGMGQVWEAVQIPLHRRVALKLLRSGCVRPQTFEMFAREARAGGRLSHPGIVAVYGSGESEGVHWIAMELVPGGTTLRDFVERMIQAPDLPDGYYVQVAQLVLELADALEAAHAAHVIHRDIKPQNVLLTAEGRPKLTDFGLARITDEEALSHTGEFAGTYFYMSPEQVAANRRQIDHRTDVFSLGVVMYELLGLVRPFRGDTAHQVAESILTHEPADLRSLRSHVPADLAVIAAKALRKERDARFQSMAEFAADLRRYLAHEPILAKPPTRWQRFAKWTRRNPTKSVAGGVAALAFLAIALLLAQNLRANRDLTRTVEERDEALGSLRTANVDLAAQTAAAQESARRAEESALAEKARADEVLRLSAMQEYDDLVAEADDLERMWPPYPERIPSYLAWIERARRLVDDLPLHRATRDELRAGASRDAPVESVNDDETADRRSAEDETEARWWSAQLTKLIDSVEALVDESSGLLGAEARSVEHGWSVPLRLAWARNLEAGFTSGAAFDLRWKAALSVILETYPGLELPVQAGLVPIGPDPASGLWEFWVVLSGAEPRRDADGRLSIEEESGMVFVLIPSGSFHMGAQADPSRSNPDPDAQKAEGPVHEVNQSAYFLAKYEVTQAQWKRLTGAIPSRFSPVSKQHPVGWTNPVETVDWTTGRLVLRRLGLELPSEAQWERGARAGTTTPYSCSFEELPTHANVADSEYKNQFSARITPELWSDGYAVHAPVGSLLPNAFGLHDMHGNIWEWCLDGWDEEFYARSPAQDPLVPWEAADRRTAHGGCYLQPAVRARSASRVAATPLTADGDVGVRAARSIVR